MNKPVNFELAKLLKEKGIVIKPLTLKSDTEYVEGYDWDIKDAEDSLKIGEFQFEDNVCSHLYLKPTIAEVVMWLYEKHGTWISVDTDINGKFRYVLRMYRSNDKAWEVKNPISISEYYKFPIKAYEAAIEYCLNNLV